MEGAHCFNSSRCDQTGLVLPVVEYDHSQGCSIAGGFVYRGQNFPRMHGIYFYADFCNGNIWSLKREGTIWQNTLLASTPFNIASFGEDKEGNLYLTDYSNGDIFLIVDTSTTSPTPTPTITTTPKNAGGESGCEIGGPIHIGTMLANTLIIPSLAALGVGLRWLIRREKRLERFCKDCFN